MRYYVICGKPDIHYLTLEAEHENEMYAYCESWLSEREIERGSFVITREPWPGCEYTEVRDWVK